MLPKKSRLPTAGRERNELIIAGILGLGLTGILLSSSYQYIPVGMATVVHFLYPSLTCIVSAILMRERMSAFNVIAMVLSIAGLYIIGGKSIEGDLKGVAFAFFSAISFTLYLIMCGKKRAMQTKMDECYLFGAAALSPALYAVCFRALGVAGRF